MDIASAPPTEAVIFDMDGVLVDSEPFWRRAEIAGFATVGLHLTEDDCRRTMGRRIDEVVAYWYGQRPWGEADDGDLAALTTHILDGVAALVAAEAEPLEGVVEAVALAEGLGLAVGLASSSPRQLIEVTLDRLGLTAAFPVVASAEDEVRGKPDPAVYLTAARLLGVAPAACVAIEDSANGVRSARAAGMRAIAVPEPGAPVTGPDLAEADHRLKGLAALEAEHLLG